MSKKRLRRRHILGLVKSEAGCYDCGERDPIVLDFDHRVPKDKDFTISDQIRDRDWYDILNEIVKCDVVCSNCHRKRTQR